MGWKDPRREKGDHLKDYETKMSKRENRRMYNPWCVIDSLGNACFDGMMAAIIIIIEHLYGLGILIIFTYDSLTVNPSNYSLRSGLLRSSSY